MSAPPPRDRRILLVDCDAYFVQVARLEDPEGAGRQEYLLVGGRPEGRGVVTSASYACRPYGVRSGMPMAQALRLCPRAVRVPVPRAACARKHREIRAVLERFAPVVSPASIDEFYLDLTGTEALYRHAPLAEVAERIRAAVREETRIDVSVGGGTSRLVAKLAVRRAKPAGVYVVPPGGEAAFVAQLQLAALPGVGPKLQERLRRLGMVSVADALKHGRKALCDWLGESTGAWLDDRIRGIDPTPVEPPGQAKSVSREETFPKDVNDDAVLDAELLRLAMRAAADLRQDGLRARTVTVKLRDGDFTTRQASRTLPRPVETDRAVYRIARELLARLRAERRVGARLLGVGLSQLTPGDGPAQLALFEDPAAASLETERDRALARALDAVRARFGARSILPGKIAGAESEAG
ncbi:MAG: DNA polymerase IV [Gemmatimonadetes bacterium]|nr:DNA polymerase IV [Gemmatimonadota bacterium]